MNETNDSNMDRDDAAPLSCLSRLASDEGASAAVEFVILIPIYILLLQALFMIANLAMVRAALVQANRFQAWAPNEPNTYAGLQDGSTLFGPYPGTFNLNPDPAIGLDRKKTAVTYNNSNASAAALPTATGAPRQSQSQSLAADALNNIGRGGSADQALWRIEAAASFQYTGILTPGVTPVTQSTQCAVLLPREHTRQEFKKNDRSDPHPVLHWRLGGATVKSRYDPTQTGNMPLSPLYEYDDGRGKMFGKTKLMGAREDGIWDPVDDSQEGARIQGSIDNEQKFYNGKPKS